MNESIGGKFPAEYVVYAGGLPAKVAQILVLATAGVRQSSGCTGGVERHGHTADLAGGRLQAHP